NNKTGEEILVGLCTRDALNKGKYKEWYTPEYRTYMNSSDRKKLDSLKLLLADDIHIKVIMGTWCHDSQVQVPRFFRMLDYLKFEQDNILIICVDTEKEAVSFSIEELNIVLVPTFIIYKEEQEIGRIIESPIISLEQDLLDILKLQP
ncbi:thioredoxin family protein, partial [Bacteroidota bacterium]